MSDERVNQREAARRLGLSVATLQKWRRTNRGPRPFFKVSGTLILYTVAGIEAWLAEREGGARKRATGSRSA